MKLRISRSQKSGGLVTAHVTFCIDARAELTSEEAADVKKYRLGKQVIYNSQRAKEYLDKADRNFGTYSGSVLIGMVNVAMAKLSLNITINSLVKGHHIEAKDMDEMLGAEQALMQACERMKAYLAVAATFDGREDMIEF